MASFGTGHDRDNLVNLVNLSDARRRKMAEAPKDGTPISHLAALRDAERQFEVAEQEDNGKRLARHERAEVLSISTASQDPDLPQEVEDISAALRIVESKLQYLRGAVDENSLAARVIDLMAVGGAEVRHQMPSLRQAVRDESEGGAA